MPRTLCNGIEIEYETFGDTSDPTVFLIAGLGWSMLMWRSEFCQALAGQGYFVVRFDNRDSGRSTQFNDYPLIDVPRALASWFADPLNVEALGAPYRLSDMAADTFGLFDALRIESAHVVGCSFGGMIAQTLAIVSPERVRSLTSIMSTPGDPSLPAPSPPVMAALISSSPDNVEAFIEQSLENLRLSGGDESIFRIDEPAVRKMSQEVWEYGRCPDGSGRQFVSGLASGSRVDELSRLGLPACVIHGKADPLFPPEHGIATANVLQNSELVLIEHLGHQLHPDLDDTIIESMTSMMKSS